MNAFVISLLGGAFLITLLLLLKIRQEYHRSFDELPTGLCAIGIDNRIQAWNRQMVNLSGIPARESIGMEINRLPAPWPAALTAALADSDESVIKQPLGENSNGDTRWVILHSSARDTSGDRRQVLVEDITDYQRLQDELLHKERLASIGRLAAGVAHEIGNPVTGIACIAQNLVESAESSELEQGTAEILKQTERITRTVNSLMQLTHPGSALQAVECVACNLADCIDEAAHLLALDSNVPSSSFDNHCDRELLVSADNQLLLQVFLNLLDNARSAANGEGPVLIDAAHAEGAVTVTIDNPGTPLSQEALAQVFEPFFTTKDVGEGTGLGLPLVERALADIGGTIALSSPAPDHDGRGTRATLTLSSARYADNFAEA